MSVLRYITDVLELKRYDAGDGHYHLSTTLQQGKQRFAATIPNAAGTSSAVSLAGYGPRGLAVQTPAAWTAAHIGFEVSTDGTTWIPLYNNSGSRVQITDVATDEARLYHAPSEAWSVGAYDYVRVVSLGTASGTAENQGAERSLSVVLLA